MTIQTRQAHKLVEGRKRRNGVEPIIGLLDFGRRLKLIWLSSEADDPYADWYLLQIEEALENAKHAIAERIAGLNELMGDRSGIVFNTAESLHPVQVPIYFQNPYGYMGAYVLVDYDHLARTIFTARHVGLLDRATADHLLQEVSTMLRRVFNLATGWKFTGVTREDIAQHNLSAQRARQTFGTECPEDILMAQRRAKYAPLIKPKKSVAQVETSVALETENNPALTSTLTAFG